MAQVNTCLNEVTKDGKSQKESSTRHVRGMGRPTHRGINSSKDECKTFSVIKRPHYVDIKGT